MGQLQSLIQIHAECIRKIYLHEWLKFMENVIYIPYIRRIWVIMNYEYGLWIKQQFVELGAYRSDHL